MEKFSLLLLFTLVTLGCAEKSANNANMSTDTSMVSVIPQTRPVTMAKFNIGVLEYVDVGSIKYPDKSYPDLLQHVAEVEVKLVIGYDVGFFEEKHIAISFKKGSESGELTLDEAKVFQNALERIQQALPKVRSVTDAFINMQFENGRGFVFFSQKLFDRDVVCIMKINGTSYGTLYLPIEKIPELLALVKKGIERFHVVARNYEGRVENLLSMAK